MRPACGPLFASRRFALYRPNAVTACALDNPGQEFSCIRREAISRVLTKQLTAQSLQCCPIIDIVAGWQQFHFRANFGRALQCLIKYAFCAPVDAFEYFAMQFFESN